MTNAHRILDFMLDANDDTSSFDYTALHNDIRNLLIAIDDDDLDLSCIEYPRYAPMLRDMLRRCTHAERIMLAESLELCPFHLIDLEICIDDNNADCAKYRD